MKLSLLVSVATVAMVLALVATPCQGQIWETLIPLITKEVMSLWKNGEREMFGHRCTYSVTPKIKSFELYFKGRMTCPSLSNERGEAFTRSRSGVEAKTVEDYVRKIVAKGVITEEEAKAWLNK
ncbi:anti-lipopolysaccharide factor-like [Penaeus japonicus]|uniref:anti-lipopolysaccharide factor-like n=1 Tax=Penaeus japonicus TaxID=27405 RepID=UPI001C70CFAE|nr:anti-lipopolysaccharide factor-like [Penaeus japonicus]XP_042886038.1 anti-lipopolysaccharide factor-like [Penaeus japonicus]XP_042886039.1 anti-lipopolysaccharide factor-like [Penaeus japonicus]